MIRVASVVSRFALGFVIFVSFVGNEQSLYPVEHRYVEPARPNPIVVVRKVVKDPIDRLLDALRRFEGPSYGYMGQRIVNSREDARVTLLNLLRRYGTLREALRHYGPGPADCRRHPEQLCGDAYVDEIMKMADIT